MDDPITRSLKKSWAAHASWARTEDRTARTAPARKAAMDRFEKEVDPDGKLSPAKRRQRAAHARKAHMLRLAAKSAEVRRARRAARDDAA